MTIDLLPCPFCGGNANARIWERDNGDAYAGVECTDCMADNSVALMWFDKGEKELSEAIAAWNRRADLTPSPEVVKELVEALRAASDALCVMLERSPAPESVIDAMSRVTAILAKLEGGE